MLKFLFKKLTRQWFQNQYQHFFGFFEVNGLINTFFLSRQTAKFIGEAGEPRDCTETRHQFFPYDAIEKIDIVTIFPTRYASAREKHSLHVTIYKKCIFVKNHFEIFHARLVLQQDP